MSIAAARGLEGRKVGNAIAPLAPLVPTPMHAKHVYLATTLVGQVCMVCETSGLHGHLHTSC